MSIARSVAKNTFVLGLGQVIVKILGVAFIAILARHVGAAGIGKFGFATSFGAIFVVFVNFGFGTLMVRDIARDRNKASSYLGHIALIKSIIMLAVSFLFFIVLRIINRPADTTAIICIIWVSLLLDSLTTLAISVFRAFEKMEYEAVTQILGSVVFVGLGITGVFLGYDLTKIVLALIFASFFKFLFSFLLLNKRFAKLKFKFDVALCKKLVIATIPFGLLMLINAVFYNTDKVMISLIRGDVEVGYYFAADKIMLVLFLVPSMYMNAIFPVFSKLHSSSKRLLETSYKKSFDYLFLTALPIAVCIFMIADKLVPLLYGGDFVNSIIVLKLLIWIVVSSFAGYINGAFLNATGRQVLFTVVYGITIIVNIVLNYFLIHKFGYIGACIATLIVTAAEFLFYSIACHYFLRISFSWRYILRSIISVLAMAVFIRFLILINMNIIIIGILAPLVYFAALYALRTFSEEDIAIIKNILKSVKKYEDINS